MGSVAVPTLRLAFVGESLLDNCCQVQRTGADGIHDRIQLRVLFVVAKVKDDLLDLEIRVSFLGLQPFCDLLKLVINGHDSYPLEKNQLFGIHVPATVDGELKD